MKCPQCKLVEMTIERVVDNVVTHKCRKCGTTITEELPKEVNNVEESK